MPISIVANASANHAQSSMRVRNLAIQDNTQRLSSGLRVFSAKEDAAAMAVGTSLRIENSALKTASLNASSGISALQIADGGMAQISDLMVRMLTLAQISSSGHQDDTTRALADREFQELKAEIDRVSKNMQFSGVSLLAGSKSFEVESASAFAAQGVGNVRFDQNFVSGDAVFRYSYDAATEVLTMNRVDGGGVATQQVDLTALLNAVAGQGRNLSGSEKLDVAFSQLGISFTLDAGFNRGMAIGQADVLAPGDVVIDAPAVGVPSFAVPVTGFPLEGLLGLQLLTTGFNAATGALTLPLLTDGVAVTLGAVPGISYRVDGGAQGAANTASADFSGAGPHAIEIYVDLPDGAGTQLIGTYSTGDVTPGATGGSLTLGVATGMVGAEYIDDDGPTRLVYKIGAGVETGLDTLNVDIPATTLSALGLLTNNILTQMNASASVDAIQAAMSQMNAARANVGAQQLRLEAVASNLSVMSENNERARSALLDADVSKEISEFASNQAMLEAGVAMLSRANRVPELLMDLLRNG